MAELAGRLVVDNQENYPLLRIKLFVSLSFASLAYVLVTMFE
jgi:hypothetical protein